MTRRETGFDKATRIAAGDDGTSYDTVAIALHWTTALLVFVLFGLAKTWDWFAKPTQESLQSLHVSLGILLAAVIVARLAFRWAQGHPADFFGLFGIAGPFGQLGRPVRHQIHELHEWVGWAIVVIALLHALAALYHHYVLKDRVLMRMLPGTRPL